MDSRVTQEGAKKPYNYYIKSSQHVSEMSKHDSIDSESVVVAQREPDKHKRPALFTQKSRQTVAYDKL